MAYIRSLHQKFLTVSGDAHAPARGTVARAQIGDRGVLGSNPGGATSHRNFGSSV